MEATALRTLRPGHEYEAFFAGFGGHTGRRQIAKAAGIPATMALIQRVARDHQVQTAKLAPTLRGATLEQTLRNIWTFVYQHIQYRLDEPGYEQVRRPARSWADRKLGVDCEDYAVFISSVLLNLGIAHKLRISAYARDWQHIYVVVPKVGVAITKELGTNKADYFTVDCVTDAFDYEVKPTKKHDYAMTVLEELSGFAGIYDEMPAGGKAAMIQAATARTRASITPTNAQKASCPAPLPGEWAGRCARAVGQHIGAAVARRLAEAPPAVSWPGALVRALGPPLAGAALVAVAIKNDWPLAAAFGAGWLEGSRPG